MILLRCNKFNIPSKRFLATRLLHRRQNNLTKRYSATDSSGKRKKEIITNIPLKSFAIGSVAGLTGSLVGLGGGFLMIPLMTSGKVFALSQHVAHGTSLFAVTAAGLAGGLSYGMKGHIDIYSGVAIAISGMISARFGAKFSTKLSPKQLKRALGVFMLAVAPIVTLKPYMESYKKLNENAKDDDPNVASNSKWKLVGISSCAGLFSGFMSGLLGVGGGAVVVPALTLFSDFDHYTILGTSLISMGPAAFVGTLTHYKARNVNMRVAPFLAVGTLVGAFAGGQLGLQIDEVSLKHGFSVMMLTLGVRTILKA